MNSYVDGPGCKEPDFVGIRAKSRNDHNRGDELDLNALQCKSSYISKRNTFCSVSPRSPCMPDVPGAYNINSYSGCIRPGSFRQEEKGPRPMRPDGQVSVRMHWMWPFCLLTYLTPPGAATPLILYPHRPASSSLRSQCSHSHAALFRTSCGRDISPSGLPPDTPARQLSFHDTLSPLTPSLTSH